jgi:hypothetical protein
VFTGWDGIAVSHAWFVWSLEGVVAHYRPGDHALGGVTVLGRQG